MTFQQLQYFLAAAEHGSFSAAAAALHMAQPSLSEQVRKLEAELGVQLFARAGRKIALTEAGYELLPHAEQTLAAAAAAAESVREVRDLGAGLVSFGTFGAVPAWLASDLVGDFRKRHPGVRVRLVGQNSTVVAEAVRTGELEAGLVALPIDDRNLDIERAAWVEVMYLSADEERCREPMTIERLAESTMILYDTTFGWSDPTRRQLLERAQRAGVKLEPAIEVEDARAALELTSRGFGDTISPIGIVSRNVVKKLYNTPFDPPLYDTFAFITRHNAPLSPAIRAFLEIARRHIGALGEPVA
jgi:DNA-binding transcriptional LysR family regulator